MLTRRRNVLRCVAILGCTILALAGCTTEVTSKGSHSIAPSSASPSPTSTSTVAKIAFSDCSKLLNLSALKLPAKRAKSLQFSCGKLAVPLDYDNPSGRKINIEVLKVHDTTQARKIGDLLMN